MAPKIDWESQIGRRLRFRDLHVLSVVVQRGSMAKAAAQLGVSQPSVSEVITDLEHAIGVRLLDRSPKGIEPTIYAIALLKRSLVAFDELKQGIRDIEFLADPALGEVRIGCPAAAMATFLPQLIQKFSEAYPKVVLRVSEVSPVAAYSGLRDRTHDLHVEWYVPPFSHDEAGNDVNVEHLFDDHLVIVSGLHSQWARRRKIDLAELSAELWMLGAFKYCQLRAHLRWISSTGTRHAKDRFGNRLCTASSPPSSEWAVHRRDAAVSCLPITRQDIAGRVAGATLALCNLYAERSNPEPGSRSVHRSPSRVRAIKRSKRADLPSLIERSMSASGRCCRKSLEDIAEQ
jgi:DNA-binding transcriptional LysR family regulator